MFADDKALLFDTVNGLQVHLNTLYQFYQKHRFKGKHTRNKGHGLRQKRGQVSSFGKFTLCWL
jgi:hypothetical protein